MESTPVGLAREISDSLPISSMGKDILSLYAAILAMGDEEHLDSAIQAATAVTIKYIEHYRPDVASISVERSNNHEQFFESPYPR